MIAYGDFVGDFLSESLENLGSVLPHKLTYNSYADLCENCLAVD